MKRFEIITYGCQMNVRDSETMAGLLVEAGFAPAEPGEQADIIVMNTCCVRENAERKLLGKANELLRYKKRHDPDMVIAIVGCMPQQEGALERLRSALPQIDVVLGTHNIHTIGDAVRTVLRERSGVFRVWDCEGEIVEGLPSLRSQTIGAFVTVMYGCDNYCSYCVVPYVRGRQRSRRVADIISEVRQAEQQGKKEIVLLGQNVNAYGQDLNNDFDFADLLREVSLVDGILRIRYMTSHPKDFSYKMIEIIGELNKVCDHFHLPVQSGSNRILKLMNRRYTREHYLELVDRIKDRLPGSSVTTDLIVGFPGETDQDFDDTLDLVRRVGFDAAFTFIYSPRSNTRAAGMDCQVPEHVKKQRIQELIKVQNSITWQKNRQMVGQQVEVLVEGPSERDPAKYSGRTTTNKMVNFVGRAEVGSVQHVNITGAGTWTLRGELAR